ncbi:uncharacterized protein PHACADRAFT_252153 [Phanerochaete carnosa HHB-10118-sp]|uniref:Uncharacterized protein n=1 Tax=Phanerochaete carnosa (strain HHB-10118-sp) TaxID=650164 RepID=K5WFM8_PHACS|nr:uncharacterized protein PHACADRAFT_252153 [Phanerochaete carnosa HHB-10118-sp]EKM58110.1 hypothetical protein PHACADRAFT_252153 [Phanerochaete carnosa HHB-10118-sp]
MPETPLSPTVALPASPAYHATGPMLGGCVADPPRAAVVCEGDSFMPVTPDRVYEQQYQRVYSM